uniref:DUF6589 domain-containing protein n=1 Tax=Amphimedon queenslandica TaxID=400682 RepID=A0A1X7V3G2_AMPQE
STQEEIVIKTCKSYNLLLGGDQLTVARSRSAISHVDNSDSPSANLTGLIPVIQDWHSKMTLLN